MDFAIHDTGKGNPHCHIMLTMRPLDERGAWAAKSKKEYDLDENGERIRLPSGKYKARKVDLTGWNDKGNALLWRKAGGLRGLLRGGFPRLEQLANPFFELSNLRPDFPDKAVRLLDIPVQLAFLGGNTFLLHLASYHAHVDGRQLVNAALGVAAVVDTLRASGAFKVGV